MSSKATHVIEGAKDIESLLREYSSKEWGPFVLREEFVEGDELHVDGWVERGEVRFASVARYLIPMLDGLRHGALAGVLISGNDLQPGDDQTLNFTRKVVKALGIQAGVFHLECFRTKDLSKDLIFSELGLRCGGGLIPEAVEAMHKVPLRKVSYELQTGEFGPSGSLAGTHRGYPAVGWALLPDYASGERHREANLSELARNPHVISLLPYPAEQRKSAGVDENRPPMRLAEVVVAGQCGDEVEQGIGQLIRDSISAHGAFTAPDSGIVSPVSTPS